MRTASATALAAMMLLSRTLRARKGGGHHWIPFGVGAAVQLFTQGRSWRACPAASVRRGAPRLLGAVGRLAGRAGAGRIVGEHCVRLLAIGAVDRLQKGLNRAAPTGIDRYEGISGIFELCFVRSILEL